MNILLDIFFIIAIFILIRYDSLKQTFKKLLAVAGVFAILFGVIQLPKLTTAQYTLKITANNEKNQESEGTEIWLNKVIINDVEYAPSEIFSSGWITENQAYVWRNYNQLPDMSAGIYARFKKNDNVELVFQKNKWRGKALIYVNHQSEVIDLYADTESKESLYTYVVSPPALITFSSQTVIFILLLILVLCNVLRQLFLHGIHQSPQESKCPNNIGSRIFWIDCLKIYAAFMIILIHASGEYFNQLSLLSDSWWKMLCINAIPRFAVPCFLMITGILCMNRSDTLKYSVNRAIQMAVTLLIWSCIYILARKLIWDTPAEILPEILKIPFNHTATHLWYGYQLFWILLTLPFWQIIYQHTTDIQKKYFIFVTLFFPACIDFLGKIGGLRGSGYAPFGSRTFCINYIGLLFLGAFIYKKCTTCTKMRCFIGGLGISMAALFLMIWSSYYISLQAGKTLHDFFGETCLPAILYGIGIIMIFYSLDSLLAKLPGLIKKWIQNISKVSVGIYFSHLFVIWCIPDIAIGSSYFSKTSGVLSVLVMVCVYFVVTAFGVLLMANIPGLKKIVS